MIIMTEIFDKLRTLQDILAKKYEIEKKIEDSPKKLTAQDELLSRLKKEYIQKNDEYEVVRKKVLELKNSLAETEATRERGEKAMDNISTHREYEALDKEIKDATDLIQSIRRDLQKEEKNLEALEEGLKQDEQLISGQEAELNAGKESLDKEIDEMRLELTELVKSEQEIIPGIDPEVIFKFERIIKSKHTGIVAVKGIVCDGCHMILPAQFANEVRSSEELHFCPYCSRILYYDEAEDTEDDYFQLDDTGSLADFEDEFSDDDDDDQDSEATIQNGEAVKNLSYED